MDFAIVTQSMAPWVYESSIIVGLPRGFRYRARFDERWIDEDIKIRLKNNERMVGLVCVRDWNTAEVFPVRKITTKNVTKIGSFFHIEYIVGDYIDYHEEDKSISNQLDRFNKNITSHFIAKKWENVPDGIMRPLIFELDSSFHIENFQNNDDGSIQHDYNMWLATINILKRFKFLHGMPFLKFSVRDNKSGLVLRAVDGEFKLSKGSKYTLNVYHYIIEADKFNKLSEEERTPRSKYMEEGPYLTELSSSAAAIEVAPPVRRFSGRYDQSSFTLSPASNVEDVTDMLLLSFTVPDDIAKSFNAIFDIPVRLRSPVLGRVIRGIAMCIAISALIFISYSSDFSTLLPEPWNSLIRDFSLVFFAFQAIDLCKTIWNWVRKI